LAVASRAASFFSRPTFYPILHPFYFLRHHASALNFRYVSWLLHSPIDNTRTNAMLMTSCCQRTEVCFKGCTDLERYRTRSKYHGEDLVLRRTFTVRMHVILRYCVTRSKSRCEPRRRGCDSTLARLSLLRGASPTLMAARKRSSLTPGSTSLHFHHRKTGLFLV